MVFQQNFHSFQKIYVFIYYKTISEFFLKFDIFLNNLKIFWEYLYNIYDQVLD